jgi:hypothetical protein
MCILGKKDFMLSNVINIFYLEVAMDNLSFAKIDIVFCAIILLFFIFGFVQGVIKQFFGILSLFLASTVSIIIPIVVNTPDIEGLSLIWKYLGISILVWIPSFLILNSIGKFISKKMSKKGPSFTDRIWGGLFGALKGIIVIVLVVFILDSLPYNLQIKVPFATKILEESRISEKIRPYNPVIKIHIMQRLAEVIAALKDNEYANILRDDAVFQKIKESEAIKQIIIDPEFIKVIEQKNYLQFITNNKVQEIVDNPEILQLILSFDIDKAVISSI